MVGVALLLSSLAVAHPAAAASCTGSVTDPYQSTHTVLWLEWAAAAASGGANCAGGEIFLLVCIMGPIDDCQSKSGSGTIGVTAKTVYCPAGDYLSAFGAKGGTNVPAQGFGHWSLCLPPFKVTGPPPISVDL